MLSHCKTCPCLMILAGALTTHRFFVRTWEEHQHGSVRMRRVDVLHHHFEQVQVDARLVDACQVAPGSRAVVREQIWVIVTI